MKGNCSQPIFLGFWQGNREPTRECLTGTYDYHSIDFLNVVETQTWRSEEGSKSAVRSIRQVWESRSHIGASQTILGSFAHLSGKIFVDDNVHSLDLLAIVQYQYPPP